MSEQAERSIIEHGEFLVDADTGEVVGLVRDRAEPFRVNDRASAEWVAERIFEAESDIAAVRARRQVLIDNLAAMEAEHTRRAAWLRIRFTDEMAAWAAAELEGKKARSIKTPFGTLAFRRKAARVVVTDEEQAVAYLEASGLLDAVKVKKSVLVSMLPDGITKDGAPGFKVEPESDGFKIVTGLL